MLDARARREPAAAVFERFVHWGFWSDPRQATGQEPDFRQAMERLDRMLVEASEVRSHQRLLDVGCGFGGTLEALNGRLNGMDLVGVNVDARQLAVARERITAGDGNRIRFVEADACSLPFPASSFDRVLAIECIFHFRSRLAFLKQVARILQPGGLLALSDFAPRCARSGGRVGRWVRREIGKGYGTLADNWRNGSYAAMAETAGLTLESDRDITANTLPTYPFLLRLMRRGSPAMRRLVWPTQVVRWASVLGLLRYRVLVLRRP